HV
ncbi:hypothetical protein ACTFIW_007315, partial [Dictyostelium discoideum]